MSIFNQIQNSKVKSNRFDLTHDVKLSAQFGKLIPICIMDCLPGDKIHISGNAMVRLAPMIAPVMHRANVYIHYFFVPNRLMWNRWEDFITGGREGNETPGHPTVRYQPSGVDPGDLEDYLGLPTNVDIDTATYLTDVNAFPFAAYRKIYNDYYRDQNFEDPVPDECVNGNNPQFIPSEVYNRAWKHDYFTSALPWTQRGPEVLLPLGEEAPLKYKPDETTAEVFQFFRTYQSPYSKVTQTGFPIEMENLNVNGDFFQITPSNRGFIDVAESHVADLSAATAASIIDLRRAFKLQEWLEKNATGGSRYIESNQVHWGVRSSDARLQRAEYIGGFQAPIKFSEVLQTSSVTGQPTPQGNMAGHGISVGGSKSYKFYCEEHGYMMGIMSVLPDNAYQNGVPRHFFRSDKFDYAWPSFAHIGEQPIYNGEVFFTNTEDELTETWGYTPRYAEYKFMPNRVAGDFRSTLDFWHMGRKFANLPPLNNNFIKMNSDEIDRIFAVTQENNQHLWVQVLNQLKVDRKLPVFGTPKM